MSARIPCTVAILLFCVLRVSRADQIVFKNGDKLSGDVTALDGGKLKIKSAVAGEITVDLKDVATFSTEKPVDIVTTDRRKLHEPIAAGEADHVKVGNDSIALTNIAKINPPPQEWTGAVVVNGTIARGNTSTEDLGVNVAAMLRRIDEDTNVNDRTTLGGAYNFGRQKDSSTGTKNTTTDNWFASGKYDRFWTPKFYGYGIMKVEHDRIADLNYRLAPGTGLGYQWVESDAMNFNTEAGLTYVYEDYITDGSDDHIALRLAYHLDKKLNDTLSLFHNMEFLPAFEDPGDYNMTTDAGIRAKLTQTMFAEFKVAWMRDSTPAPGADKNDLRYILGLGWSF